MGEYLSNIASGIGITDVIDIAIVAFVIYKILGFIQETRAEQLVKGIALLVFATIVSGEGFLNLYTINWVLRNVMTVGMIALVVIFQPELRRGLESVGRNKILNAPFSRVEKSEAKSLVSEIVRAITRFSDEKTGALIIFERTTKLNEIVETGTIVDARISAEMLGNIFYEGAPLHDGAAVIRGGRVHAAGCVLPLTSNKDLSKDLGTRHRAGIGITENSDALVLIVSEETGIISMAENGRLTRFLDVKTVEKTLLGIYLNAPGEKEEGIASLIRTFVKGTSKGGGKDA